MSRKKINPPRRKTKEQERADYRKQLAARQVSGTVETTEETKAPIVGELDSTDKILPIEQTPIPLTKEIITPSQKLSKIYTIIGIVGGIILILTFVGTLVYHYTSVKEGLNHTNTRLTELMQTINERIDRLEERIDKYISKEKSK